MEVALTLQREELAGCEVVRRCELYINEDANTGRRYASRLANPNWGRRTLNSRYCHIESSSKYRCSRSSSEASIIQITDSEVSRCRFEHSRLRQETQS